MDKYRKLAREKEPIGSDEIRITSTGRVLNYVSYAARLLTEQDKKQLTIKATGNAIARAVILAEVIKRRFKGLHQLTTCGSTTIKDVYEPTEEGLDQVTEERVVSFLEITLSFEPLDEKHPGYQPPLDESFVKEIKAEDIKRTAGFRGRARSRGGGFRGRFRGGFRGGYRGRGGGGFRGRGGEGYDYDGGDFQKEAEYGTGFRGRGRGRGRGYRGVRGVGGFRGSRRTE